MQACSSLYQISIESFQQPSAVVNLQLIHCKVFSPRASRDVQHLRTFLSEQEYDWASALSDPGADASVRQRCMVLQAPELSLHA